MRVRMGMVMHIRIAMRGRSMLSGRVWVVAVAVVVQVCLVKNGRETIGGKIG